MYIYIYIYSGFCFCNLFFLISIILNYSELLPFFYCILYSLLLAAALVDYFVFVCSVDIC